MCRSSPVPGVIICCTLWDSYCEKLLSYWRTRSQTSNVAIILTQAKIKPASDDPKCFPKDLDVILGCTWTFKVKLHGKNRPASVMRVSTNVEIIDHIKTLLGQEEASQGGECMVSCPSDIVPDTSNSSASQGGECMVSCPSDIVPDTSNSSASQGGECMVSCPSDIVPDTSNSSAMVIGKCSNVSVSDVPTSSGTSLINCFTMFEIKCIGNDACDLTTDTDSSLMCLSSTVDDEPDIVFYMTPFKDVCAPIDDVPDIPSSIMEFDFLEDIPLAQLLATKTTKPIKSIKKEKL
ncbi:hypothetical protein DEO72_LG6g1997 [Vigna unguiculata]|uniref:Uncharacterized protein n=1 Tax=Vigna unguiculata TaxID=3917 RepID=A0A4D6M8K6_VIGUN|nr:hypothetical protein DEO72_LG6g1997 [Vigna unguiculata]